MIALRSDLEIVGGGSRADVSCGTWQEAEIANGSPAGIRCRTLLGLAMKANHNRLRRALLAGVVVILASAPLMAIQAPKRSATSDQDRVATLIKELAHPVFAKRRGAERELRAVGMPAIEQLRVASAHGDAETSLRAQAVLNDLDRLMLAGVDVHVSFSKPKIEWDESVDLMITLSNASRYAAKIPFDLSEAATDSEAARQVGHMVDLAEIVRVRDGRDSELDLTVDDIGADSAVLAAVQDRLDMGPTGELAPGERRTLTVGQFNRGWARYRLLDAGTYTIVLDYRPQWDDEVLVGRGVGRVTSNEATIVVTRGAPKSVSRGGRVASVEIRREDRELVSVLTNHTDQTMVVNTDFGDVVPFAEGHWIWQHGSERLKIPVVPPRPRSWDDFVTAKLVSVAPGATIELARISIQRLYDKLKKAGGVPGASNADLHFSYANMCSRLWQTRQGSALVGNDNAPRIFRTLLPRQLLATRYNSGALAMPLAP